MWEESCPWHNAQRACLGDLSTRQGEAIPPLHPQDCGRGRRKEGGTQEEGTLMGWHDSCASGCGTYNCCTCGFRDDLLSSLLGAPRSKPLRLFLVQILQVLFGTHLLFLLAVFQFLLFPLPASEHSFLPLPGIYDSFHVLYIKVLTAATTQASSHPQSQHFWYSITHAFSPSPLNIPIHSMNHLDAC